MKHSPVILFGAAALIVTGTLAWLVKFFYDITQALQLPKETNE